MMPMPLRWRRATPPDYAPFSMMLLMLRYAIATAAPRYACLMPYADAEAIMMMPLRCLIR